MTRNILGLLLVGSILMFAGCGPKGHGLKVEYVEGVVTLDGQPLEGASVTFVPKTEGGKEETASGHTNKSGVYKLSSVNGDAEKGAVAGDYVVNVSKIKVEDPKEGMSYEQATMSTKVVKQVQLLHKDYQDRKNSPLSFTVKPGKNKIDLELKSKP